MEVTASSMSVARRRRGEKSPTRDTRTGATIGRQVREARTHLGMDQRELALVADVSVRTVHAVEHGKSTVRMDVLVRVLQAVGLDLAAVPRDRSRGTKPR